ncbi:FKBP-type peptidyl-prolyl cis-trans isomerase [Nonomuraea sp. NPDC049152]|uniref:FKBP-type peptidyl-prolyl cis-trans isomerase n=1 Tax=Nonomuraea sp. NPDC049152 TaxID=3154350 RepID=UPI0034050676
MRAIVLLCLVFAVSCAPPATPTVTGAFGERPVIEVPLRRPEPTPTVSVLSEGSGPRTRRGDVVLAEVEIRRWDGAKPYVTTYDTNQPTAVVLDGRHVSQAWERALVDRPVGSRVMLVSPAHLAYGPRGTPGRADSGQTLVLVFDILAGYPPDARLVGRRLPDLPDTLRPGVLIDGSGPPVTRGARVVVQYVGARWPSRKVFDSSSARGGPNVVVLKEGAVPPGWVEGLTGRRVGSRVAITAPAVAKEVLTAGGMAVPAGTALVYVVDIIGMV